MADKPENTAADAVEADAPVPAVEPEAPEVAPEPDPAPVEADAGDEEAFVAEPGFGHPDDTPAPAIVEPVADDGSLAPRDHATEAEATALNADLAAQLVPLTHPDGGTCDRYETDKKTGFLMVPASDVADMAALGFVVAIEGDE